MLDPWTGRSVVDVDKNDQLTRGLRYLARTISTSVAAFFALFYFAHLGEFFQGGGFATWTWESTGVTVVVFSLAVGTALAWWREGVGGVIVTLIGIVGVGSIFLPGSGPLPYVIGFPFLLSGILFLYCARRTRTTADQRSATSV